MLADKELVSVRKRMLKRELESRRGNLQKQCELTSKVRAALIETVLSDVGAVHDAFMNKLQVPPSLLADHILTSNATY